MLIIQWITKWDDPPSKRVSLLDVCIYIYTVYIHVTRFKHTGYTGFIFQKFQIQVIGQIWPNLMNSHDFTPSIATLAEKFACTCSNLDSRRKKTCPSGTKGWELFTPAIGHVPPGVGNCPILGDVQWGHLMTHVPLYCTSKSPQVLLRPGIWFHLQHRRLELRVDWSLGNCLMVDSGGMGGRENCRRYPNLYKKSRSIEKCSSSIISIAAREFGGLNMPDCLI